MYIIVVTSLEVQSANFKVITENGEKFVLVDEDGYTTSTPYDPNHIPREALTWEDRVEAEVYYYKYYKDHPWWVRAKDHEIVEVSPKQSNIIDHYEAEE